MRIIVYPHLLSIGGSQLNAIELAAAVRDRGHDVTVFSAENGPLAETIARFGLHLDIAPPHKKRPSLHIAKTLRTLCRTKHIDIVHGYEWPPSLEAFVGAHVFDDVAVGCTIMSMSVAPFLPPSMPLIVGTEQIAAAARQSRSGVVHVIEPPVDTESNHPGIDGLAFRAEHGIGSSPLAVLVSRLALALKLEGLERSIAAVALIAPETGVRLAIVGDGPARSKLERMAAEVNARTGQPTVILTGELPDPRAAYSAADLVLGMGGSALRAMAFAKPVVVLGERGFARLLAPDSIDQFLWQGFYGLGSRDTGPNALAAIIRGLLDDPARRADLGVFSRRIVDSRFSLKQSAERQEQLYREWLTSPSARWTAAREALTCAALVLDYKVRRRWSRMRGREASEDFNAVGEIAKTAALGDRAR